MIDNKNLPYYATAIAAFLLLKYGYTLSDTADLRFLLQPTDALVGIITNSTSHFIAESGYIHERLNIVIDKSCSGFNFWILCFIMLSFSVGKYLRGAVQQVIVLPALLLVAYLFTIFVNASRILLAVLLLHPSVPHFDWLHEAAGHLFTLVF